MDKKIEKCRHSFPHIGKENGEMKVVYICTKEGFTEEKQIDDADCENCKNYKGRYIEYPITVSKIEQKAPEYNCSSRTGSLAKIRPCGEEYKGKTYLGIFLGDLPTNHYVTHNSESNILTVNSMTNPAIYVFELKKIIFGYESWWSVIESIEELEDITDEDINSVWYVQLAKAMIAKNENENNLNE